MANKSLLRWCQSVLPANYQSIKGLTEKYQQFLVQQLPEDIIDSVRVINVDQAEVVIAAVSGQIANYLRLHMKELTQQFDETFGGNRKITIKAMPASLLQIESRQATARPRSVSKESIDSIETNAKWIEDEALKKALESLADQLKKN
ncbi:MAG: DUF721 domain-containing protein [Gammaproteobacteria bacterium]|nr:DUF721 domain-containing protein [Gammaproteobacteria bacterium]